MEKSIPDSGNVFERLHLAMEAFCGSDNLRQRLLAVRRSSCPSEWRTSPGTCEDSFVS